MNTRRALVVVILGVLSASFALAQQAPSPPDAKKARLAQTKAAPPPGVPSARSAGGLVVFIDPATGQIRQPDAVEIGSLAPPPAAVTSVDEAPLAMKFGPGGAVGIVLDSRFESFMVVTRTPDGKLTMDCVTGSKKADEAVLGGVKTARKPRGREVPLVQ